MKSDRIVVIWWLYGGKGQEDTANWFVLNMPEHEPSVVSARDTCMFVCLCLCAVYLALELKTVLYFKRLCTLNPNSLQSFLFGDNVILWLWEDNLEISITRISNMFLEFAISAVKILIITSNYLNGNNFVYINCFFVYYETIISYIR